MTIVLWIASFVFASQHAYAQGPYCADQKCNTQRIQQPAFYLADSMGLALTASDLMNDQSHQTSYLWLTFTLAETQYNVNIVGDILADSAYQSSFNQCLGKYSAGTHKARIALLNWDTKLTLEVENILLAGVRNKKLKIAAPALCQLQIVSGYRTVFRFQHHFIHNFRMDRVTRNKNN